MDKSKKLVAEIIEITGSEKSKGYYRERIKTLGYGTVVGLKDELKLLIAEGKVDSPARYFTTMLKNESKERPPEQKNRAKDKAAEVYKRTQAELFNSLILKDQDRKQLTYGNSKVPYSDKWIPQETLLSAGWFTLTTNKKRTDEITVKIPTDNGMAELKVLRGRISPTGKARGILTVSHKKVFDALKILWIRKGKKYTVDINNRPTCHLTVSAREVSEVLGWKNVGGKDLTYLKDLIFDLKAMPNYIIFPDSDLYPDNAWFTLLDKTDGAEMRKEGEENLIVFDITFSTLISQQLLNQDTVQRSLEMLYTKSDIAHLTWQFIEPVLRANGRVQIKLETLIKELNLPKRTWHKYKSQRKQRFEKPIKELDGQVISGHRQIQVKLIKTKDKKDYKLVGNLIDTRQTTIENI